MRETVFRLSLRPERMSIMAKLFRRIFLLLLLLTLPVCTAAQGAGSVPDAGEDNLQFLFAQLQLELAQQNMAQAQQRVEQIQQDQQEHTRAAEILVQLRQLQSAGGTEALPADVAAFLDQRQLAYGTAAAPDYTLAIRNLEDYQENLSSSVQDQMVYIQDFIGQYNQYTFQGSGQQSTGLAGLSRGSLFSEGGGVGIAALCAAGGLAVGMVLMWAIQRARAKGQA